MAWGGSRGPGWPGCSPRCPWGGSTALSAPAQGKGPPPRVTSQPSPPRQLLCHAVGAPGAGRTRLEVQAGLAHCHQVPGDEEGRQRRAAVSSEGAARGGVPQGDCTVLTASGPWPGVCRRRCTSLGGSGACNAGGLLSALTARSHPTRSPRWPAPRGTTGIWVGWAGQEGQGQHGLGAERTGWREMGWDRVE